MKMLTKEEAMKVFVEPYWESDISLSNAFSRVAYTVIDQIYNDEAVSLSALVDLERLKDLIDNELIKEKENEKTR